MDIACYAILHDLGFAIRVVLCFVIEGLWVGYFEDLGFDLVNTRLLFVCVLEFVCFGLWLAVRFVLILWVVYVLLLFGLGY